jgi:N-acetylneuraminic acid mutarotase
MTSAAITRRIAVAGLGAALLVGACAQGQDAGTGVGDALSPGWTAGAPLSIRVQEIYPAAVDGTIYVAGGLSPDVDTGQIGITDRVFALEPGAQRWRERASLPIATHHPNLVTVDDEIYAIGGFTAAPGGAWAMTNAVRIYDPERNEWRNGPAMAQPYAETVVANLDGNIHVVTGRRPAGPGNANWNDHADTTAHVVLDPVTGAWRAAAPAPTARNSAAGAVLEGRLHVIGGRTVSGGNTALHEVYDPETDRWATLAPLPEPLQGPRGAGGLAAAVLDGTIYVFGGEWFSSTGGGVYQQVWAYDAASDSWSEASTMPTPRHGLGAVTVDGRIATIGGAARAGGNETSAAVEWFEG